MSKHARSPSPHGPVPGGASGLKPTKKPRIEAQYVARKIATPEAAARVDANPPFAQLLTVLKETTANPAKGDAVLYWMRMEDMRISDNRALAQASAQARKDNVPLVVLFVLSPEDYHAHDRSPRRIDFTLRNLRILKSELNAMNIPLHTITHTPRRTLPDCVANFMDQVNAKHVYANMEYEVDELRRDIKLCSLAKQQGIQVSVVHDKLVIEPGVLSTKQGKTYTVYSPFQRTWLDRLNKELHRIEAAPAPAPNEDSARDLPALRPLFDTDIPDAVEGFECKDRDLMDTVWPAGTDNARKILQRFLHTKARAKQLGAVDPLAEGAEDSPKLSRLLNYAEGRNRSDRDTSSRMSPYLAAGVISVRECIRETMNMLGEKRVQGTRDTGAGMWTQELAWRDFYTHIMALFPRVSMGRPFQEKFADVQWEVNEGHLQAWKEGRTGVPIVDAGMRQCMKMGWMHNRVRMICAMYLVKDLMIDWRLGEKHFMECFIDGDLASNDGGWQWSASTGTDAQPYFRIFNPYSQSQKADPTGDYIRTFVPELSKLYGPDIHHPSATLAKKLGYPEPLVDHNESRQRALRRYKNPGEA